MTERLGHGDDRQVGQKATDVVVVTDVTGQDALGEHGGRDHDLLRLPLEVGEAGPSGVGRRRQRLDRLRVEDGDHGDAPAEGSPADVRGTTGTSWLAQSLAAATSASDGGPCRSS